MGVGTGLPLCFWLAGGIVTFRGGVAFADIAGIVVGEAANVDVGAGGGVLAAVGEAGAVGVGECLPGGVLVGFAVEILADSRSAVVACVFVIPPVAPMHENRSSVRENAATIAREIVGLASLE